MLQGLFTNLESIWVSDLFEDRYLFLFNFTSNLHNTKNFWVSAQQLFFEWINVWIVLLEIDRWISKALLHDFQSSGTGSI